MIEIIAFALIYICVDSMISIIKNLRDISKNKKDSTQNKPVAYDIRTNKEHFRQMEDCFSTLFEYGSKTDIDKEDLLDYIMEFRDHSEKRLREFEGAEIIEKI